MTDHISVSAMYYIRILFLVATFYQCIAAIISPSDVVPTETIHLPLGYNSFCNLSQRDPVRNSAVGTLAVSCFSRQRSQFNFAIFRQWSKDISGFEITLLLECSREGSVSLPWPMKAYNLVSLSVRYCIIDDFFVEYTNNEISTIPDQLKVLRIRDSVMDIKLPRFFEIMNNFSNISKDVECGPQTVKELTMRNVTKTFSYTKNIMEYLMRHGGIISLGENFLHAAENSEHVCNYENLLYFDESNSGQKSSHHMKLLANNAKFPVLVLFNLSAAGMINIPEELQQWYTNFPRLTYLDLSHNKLERFYFASSPLERSVLYVNLQHNNIQTISAVDIMALSESQNIRIDIRNNPLHCDCHLQEFYKFLQSSSSFLIPRELTCATPVEHAGVSLMSLRQDELICSP